MLLRSTLLTALYFLALMIALLLFGVLYPTVEEPIRVLFDNGKVSLDHHVTACRLRSEVSALAWDHARRWLVVGTHAGLVQVFTISPDCTQCNEEKLLQGSPIHY